MTGASERGWRDRRAAVRVAVVFAGLLPFKAQAQAPAPLTPDQARGSVVVWCAESCGELGPVEISQVARIGPLQTGPALSITELTDSDSPPVLEDIGARGIGDLSKLPTAQSGVRIRWVAPASEASRRALEIGRAAMGIGDWIEDPETARIFTRDTYGEMLDQAERDPAAPGGLWAVEQTSDTIGRAELRAVGLGRIGLPELATTLPEDGDPIALSEAMTATTSSLIAKQLLPAAPLPTELQFIREDGPCGVAGTATLEPTMRRAGLLGDMVIRVNWAAEPPTCAPASTLEEAQGEALARLRGPVHGAWDDGLPVGDRLMVKAPFQTEDGDVEWLWLDVAGWSGERVSGPLASTPQSVQLSPGDEVATDLLYVFDYLWVRADGTQEGNTTGVFVQ